MKIRIKIPDTVRPWDTAGSTEFVDEVLLWAMEAEMDVTFYNIGAEPASQDQGRIRRQRYAVFTVEPEMAFMFILKWGASQHRIKRRQSKVAKLTP